jgi:hypothetical protein
MDKKGSSSWTRSELAILGRLRTPAAVQEYLDKLPYRCEDGHLCARAALRDRRAHCFDGALLAAAALRRAGFVPYLVDLCAVRDDDHMICAYRYGARWGAVAKSNFPGLRLREPLFRDVRALVLSYFEFYFNMRCEKTLRNYSSPLRLPDPARLDWECDDSVGDQLVDHLGTLRHYNLLEPRQERMLRRVDSRLFQSQLVGVNLRGVRR